MRLFSPARRLLSGALLTSGLLLAGAGPALAHVEAEAEPGAQAGDGPVTITVTAESESSTDGIVGAKTQLPQGVLPERVSLASGPVGWAVTPTADGYEVGGPALEPGQDAVFSITIGRLPADLTEFPLKTLLRYSDGREDAWIEEVTPNNPDPENPAPIVTVAPPAAPATSSSATSSAPAPSSATPSAASADAQESSSSTSTSLVVIIALVVVVVAIGALYWFLRRRARAS